MSLRLATTSFDEAVLSSVRRGGWSTSTTFNSTPVLCNAAQTLSSSGRQPSPSTCGGLGVDRSPVTSQVAVGATHVIGSHSVTNDNNDCSNASRLIYKQVTRLPSPMSQAQAARWCYMLTIFLQILLILSPAGGYRLQFFNPRAHCV